MRVYSYALNNVKEAIDFILKESPNRIILFKGEMGSGKTTLIKSLVKGLGSDDVVSSPTFSLVNEYRNEEGPIYHFDLYRLEDEEEAYAIGMEEYLDSGAWCFVEWPDKARSILPKNATLIEIKVLLNGKRELHLS
ncbi:tRNA (adenosine(37)-N6)-threonylcarbamoyltransferase complex ATPase subunit type 1 TsaE [Robertkochia marina]|uniref:tRNA threonylcarbamoyladenosine biosynthesis protein TsaE n=1 Tax=Robertkochia marina TaxID=1227945 RepID=A0A4S3M373_9FLAO|nr:tRNA (adenosine(37)-N6)-threonylcarbamoyltransferase complex ATPase subunit type 1 TsaE [Robertkochia marina]THD67945.1 tRNA (adenosine(37)-N6)-threonylcarbamoyltransferase complex ATPase subunit type 1 TsaE [Robertkochia marina]